MNVAVILANEDVEGIELMPFSGKLEEIRDILVLEQRPAKDKPLFPALTVERIKTPIKDLIMLVDEDGRLKKLPPNRRASSFYAGTVYGTVILTYEKPILDDEGEVIDVAWMGVPNNFNYELVAETSYDRLFLGLQR